MGSTWRPNHQWGLRVTQVTGACDYIKFRARRRAKQDDEVPMLLPELHGGSSGQLHQHGCRDTNMDKTRSHQASYDKAHLPRLPASPGAILAEARASTKRSGCQAGRSNMVSQARSRPMALRQSMKCTNNTWWPSGTWRTHHMLTHPGNQVPSHAHPMHTLEAQESYGGAHRWARWHTCWLPGHCQTQHVLPDSTSEPVAIRSVRRIVEQDASLLQLHILLNLVFEASDVPSHA